MEGRLSGSPWPGVDSRDDKWCVSVVVRKLLGKGVRATTGDSGGKCVDDKAGCDMGVTGAVQTLSWVSSPGHRQHQFTAVHAGTKTQLLFGS